MLKDEAITQRLEEMVHYAEPTGLLWPENCAGSRKALVIFVGPSPGGKEEDTRREIKLNCNKPLWNKAYCEPLRWSRGFQVSFIPIVEALFNKPYDIAAKLIARVNMDWLGNPEARNVSYRYMWEGCSYILPVIFECKPDLIIPMDKKSFGVMQIALFNDGYEIIPTRIGSIKVRASKASYHKSIMAFGANKEDRSFLIIKSLQHPARIYDIEYASGLVDTKTRIGYT